MENKQTHAGEQAYDENFYRIQKDGSFKSAMEILPLVNEFIRPRSVVDVGCGVGTWLAAWKHLSGGVLTFTALTAITSTARNF